MWRPRSGTFLPWKGSAPPAIEPPGESEEAAQLRPAHYADACLPFPGFEAALCQSLAAVPSRSALKVCMFLRLAAEEAERELSDRDPSRGGDQGETSFQLMQP